MKPKFYKLNDRGAALIAGLLIMVVLSILGITTMQSSLLQERMAGNMEQRDVSFELAEAGLRDGEAWLNSLVALPAFDGTSGRYQQDSNLWRNGVTWGTLANRMAYTGYTNDDDVFFTLPTGTPLPLYYIEYLADVDNSGEESVKFGALSEELPGMYRITSRGVSPNQRAEVILQTTFIR